MGLWGRAPICAPQAQGVPSNSPEPADAGAPMRLGWRIAVAAPSPSSANLCASLGDAGASVNGAIRQSRRGDAPGHRNEEPNVAKGGTLSSSPCAKTPEKGAPDMPRELATVLLEARLALNIPSQGAFGVALGSSKHTGQRWERGQAEPTPTQLHQLARLVYPKDPKLAAEIAAAGRTTLAQLGIAPLPSAVPSAPPARSRPEPIHIVDTVVCAAAEVMQ